MLSFELRNIFAAHITETIPSRTCPRFSSPASCGAAGAVPAAVATTRALRVPVADDKVDTGQSLCVLLPLADPARAQNALRFGTGRHASGMLYPRRMSAGFTVRSRSGQPFSVSA
ncbi:hypothetical protein [Massilia litorea]|uniref:Uncharacterized protein n=1 Tax=Massilia litorea TaxID=2769491 RepID=A0A7L9U0H3_9BURK|nr:hypothetical protein [Massilia litorea]QOL47762.1 hypothetical protein LPB04_12035 [Massilia litorea]